MSLRKILTEEGLFVRKASAVDSEVINAIKNSWAPIGEILTVSLDGPTGLPGSPGRKVKIYVPNWEKTVISQIKRAPRKWVLQEFNPNSKHYHFPYDVTLATGTFDPVTREFNVDPHIDVEAAAHVGRSA